MKRFEHWGDEGQLHVAAGWVSRREVVGFAADYIKADLISDPVALREALQDVTPENVRYGWAIIVPGSDTHRGHPLHKGYYDDGEIILGPLHKPPFFVMSKGGRVYALMPRPVTWLRDH